MNVHDKYIIEIGEIIQGENGPLARIKGFHSLVFDENGLSKLASAEPTNLYNLGLLHGYKGVQNKIDEAKKKSYDEGYNDALVDLKEALLDSEFIEYNYGCKLSDISMILAKCDPTFIVEDHDVYIGEHTEDEKPDLSALYASISDLQAEYSKEDILKSLVDAGIIGENDDT